MGHPSLKRSPKKLNPKQYFIVEKLKPGEIVQAYSIVDEETLKDIDSNIIHAKLEVKDKLYTKEDLEALRNALI